MPLERHPRPCRTCLTNNGEEYDVSKDQQDKGAEMAFAHRNFGVVEKAGDSNSERERMRYIRAAGLSHEAGKNILDCGCGAGKDSAFLARLGNLVAGIDISEDAVRTAKLTASTLGASVEFIVADTESLPFKSETFDICYCSWTLHHMPSPDKAFQQIRAILKGGGRLTILEPNGSNLVVKISEHIEHLIRNWLVQIGVDTPNENLHTPRTYITSLARLGYRHPQIRLFYGTGLPPLSEAPNVISFLALARSILLMIGRMALPGLLGASDVIVVAEVE